jgi:CRP-like cAMP-binding protein
VQIFNSSESFSPDESRQLAVFAKPENAKAFLRKAISVHYLFESLGEEDLNRIIDCMRPTFAAIGETVIRQGELGDLFFCLETGTASAAVDGNVVMSYQSGGCFGELALIYNSPRAASVIADTACKLWTLDLRTFRYILATTSSSKMVTRCEFLKKCLFLDPLSNEQISKLAGALETYLYEDGEYIIRQGDAGDAFFIIEEGNVKCTQIKSSGREVDLL